MKQKGRNNLIVSMGKSSQFSLQLPNIFINSLKDIFLYKTEIKIQHCIILCFIGLRFYLQIPYPDEITILTTFLQTEISTLFYVLQIFLEHRIKDKRNDILQPVSTLNKSIFIATFIYYRLYKYYKHIIYNPHVYNNIYILLRQSKYNIFVYMGLYGLFFMNCYWLIVMCKTYCSPLLKDKKILLYRSKRIDTRIITHIVTSYTLFVNVAISCYIYYEKMYSIPYSLDIAGTTYMAVNSFIYHNKCAIHIRTNKELDYMNPTIIESFVFDKGGIHLRSFFCVLTSLYNKWEPLHQGIVTYLANTLSFLFLNCFVKNQIEKEVNQRMSTKNFLLVTNLLTSIPILLDAMIVITNTNHINLRINVLIVTGILGILLQVEPFYELNHIAIHLALLVQSAALSLCILYQ